MMNDANNNRPPVAYFSFVTQVFPAEKVALRANLFEEPLCRSFIASVSVQYAESNEEQLSETLIK
jgi:hypothetical protein